jgi:hypothetical protein
MVGDHVDGDQVLAHVLPDIRASAGWRTGRAFVMLHCSENLQRPDPPA